MEKEDLEKQKKVEAGREKFAAYKKKKNITNNEQKKKKKNEEGEADSISETSEIMADGGASSLSPSEEQSSISDERATMQSLQERVKELEDILEGKNVCEVALQELDSPRGMETEYKEQLEACRKRVVEFQAVVEQRDDLIKQLSGLLQQANTSRDALQLQGEQLAGEVALLQRQLQATMELVQDHKSHDYLTLQNKMLAMDSSLQKQIDLINRLNTLMAEKDAALRNKDAELEKKSQDLNQHKTQSAVEVQQLMRKVEELHQCNAAAASMKQEHEKQLATLRAELEENFGLQLVQIKDELRMQFSEEKAVFMRKHSEELENTAGKAGGDLHGELGLYKQQVEDLSQQLSVTSTSKEELASELTRYRNQLHSLEERLLVVTKIKDDLAKQFIEQKATFESELFSYKQQVVSLNEKVKSCRSEDEVAQELELFRQSHSVELSSWREQVNTLNIELQKVSEIAQSSLLKLEDCKKLHETELSALVQTHAAEVDFLNEQLISVQSHKWQMDQLNLQLQEKTKAEERLKTELQVAQEEVVALRQTSEMHSYMKQLDELNAELRVEDTKVAERVKLQHSEDELVTITDHSEVQSYKEQLNMLNEQLQEKTKIVERLKDDLHAAQSEVVALQEINKVTVQNMQESELESGALKKLQEIQSYKNELDLLNIQLREKVKSEAQLKSELQTAQEELLTLRESSDGQLYKQVDILNMQLQERIKTEEKLRNELQIVQNELKQSKVELDEVLQDKSKTDNELREFQCQVEMLNAKVLDLSSNADLQSSLEMEIKSLKKELETCKVYILELEQMKEQVTNTSKTKEELIKELTVSVKSLKEDDASYKKQLDTLHMRLDEESHKVDENFMLHQSYESEIDKYKQQIMSLNTQLQKTCKAEEEHLSKISSCQSELTGYKMNLEALSSKFNEELTRAQFKYSEEISTSNQQLETLKQNAAIAETELAKYKEEVELLTTKLEEVGEQNELHILDVVSYKEQIDVLNNKLKEHVKLQEQHELELSTDIQEIDTLTIKLQENETKYSKDLASYKHTADALEAEILSHEEQIKTLNIALESARNALNTGETSLKEYREKLSKEEEKAIQLNQEKNAAEELYNANIANINEAHNKEITFHIQKEEALQLNVEELTLSQQNYVQEIKEYNQKIVQCNALLSEKSLAIEKYEEQLSVKEIELHGKEGELINVETSLKEQIELMSQSYNKEIDAHKMVKESLQLELRELNCSHQKCLSDMEELKRKYDYSTAQLSEKDVTIEKCKEKISAYQDELLQLQEDMRMNDKLQEDLKTIQKEKSDVELSLSKTVNMLDERHTSDIMSYKNQLGSLQVELQNLAIAHHHCTQELERQQQKLKECNIELHEKNVVVEKYKDDLNVSRSESTQVTEDMKMLDVKLNEKLKTLQEEKLAVTKSFNQDIETLNEIHSQTIASYIKQEEALLAQVKELESCYKSSSVAIEESHQKLSECNSQLSEKDSIIQTYTESMTVCQAELLQSKEDMKLLDSRLHEELKAVQDELSQLKSTNKMFQDQINIERNKDTVQMTEHSHQEERMQVDNNAVKTNVSNAGEDSVGALSQKSTTKLVTLSESRCIEELEENLNKLNLHYQKQGAILVEKEELEKSLKQHIKELEGKLVSKEEKKGKIVGQGNSQLEEMTVQYLKTDSLLAGKEEIEQSLTYRIQELEKSFNEACVNLTRVKQENAQLTLRIVKAKELLKKFKIERDEAKAKCTLLEEEREKLLSNEQRMTNIVIGSDIVGNINDSSRQHSSSNDTDEEVTPLQEQKILESSPVTVLKWMEQCTTLEHDRKELTVECESLRTKLEDREAHERLFNEEMVAAQLRCEKLEKRLIELEKCESTIEKLIQIRMDLEFKLENLESENKVLKETESSLRSNLVTIQMEYEEKLQSCVQDHLCVGKDKDKIEEIILDLGNKTKEVIILRDQLKSQEHQQEVLLKKLKSLEESKDSAVKQFELFRDEVFQTRTKLEEAWQEHEDTEKELGRARKELVLLQLRREQLETSRMIDTSSELNEMSILSMQQEVHHMVEDLAAEVVVLKQSLQAERSRAERLALELKGGEVLEMQQKLELILQSNADLVAEKEKLLKKLQSQQELVERLKGGEHDDRMVSVLTSQQNQLLAELAAYREQHSSLAEVIGCTGTLQETLHQQKQELILKFQEKAEIEQKLEAERTELRRTQLKLQLLEQQMMEKDNVQQELRRQKMMLEAELHEIEDRLRDQVDCLHTQKLDLEAQIRSRDIQIRQCKLEVRAKEVEINAGILPPISLNERGNSDPSGGDLHQRHLDALRIELDEAHSQAIARLKQHLNEQFTLHETQLQENFTSELYTLHTSHQEQLAALRQELVEKTRQVESLVSNKIEQKLGLKSLQLEDLSALKVGHERELDNIKTGLEEGQVQLYALLKHKFEGFAQQLIAYSLKMLKEEQELVRQEEMTTLKECHRQKLLALRCRLEQERLQELLIVRQEQTQMHKDEVDAVRQSQPAAFKSLADECAVVTRIPETASSHILLDQLKQQLYTEYRTSLKGLGKMWQDNWRDKQAAIITTGQNLLETMEKEQSGLHEAGSSTSKLESLLDSWEKMLIRAEELQEKKLLMHKNALQQIDQELEPVHSQIACKVEEVRHTASNANLQYQLEELTKERDQHRLAVELLSSEHTIEVVKLRDLVTELETKHTKEMEELRQYFEQKVAEVEKHYSEDIVSQHSRRLSGSSCGSDSELVSDMYYGGGDIGPRLSTITHICDSFTAEPSYKDIEDRYRADFEKRLAEYHDQLETVKQDLEKKYEGELTAVRIEYEDKVDHLVKELSSSHQTEINNLETKHAKEIENMKAKWKDDLAREVNLAQQYVLELEKSITIKKTLEITHSNSTQDQKTKQQIEGGGGDAIAKEQNYVSKEKLELCSENVDEESKAKQELQEAHQVELTRLKATYEHALQDQVEQMMVHLQQKEQNHMETLKTEVQEHHTAEMLKLQQLYTEHVVDEAGSTSAEAALQKVQLEEHIRQEIHHELELELEQKVEQVAAVMKANSEQEQAIFIDAQNQMMKSFLEQHRQDLVKLKAQYETSMQNEGQQYPPLATRSSQSWNQNIHDTFALQSRKQHKEVQTCISEFPKETLLLVEEQGSAITMLPKQSTNSMHSSGEITTDELRSREQNVQSLIGAFYLEESVPIIETMHIQETSVPHQEAYKKTTGEARKPDPSSRSEEETFQLQIVKVKDAHASDLQLLHSTWQSMMKKLIHGEEPLDEMKKLKENFIKDCTTQFEILLEHLEAEHLLQVQKVEKIIQKSQSNLNLKESLHEEEMAQLKANYARQLHADVEQAKHDIATALEEQIQVLLAADETTPRPRELVLLQEKLVAPYRRQLREQQEKFQQQVTELKSEHEAALIKSALKPTALQESGTDEILRKDANNDKLELVTKERDQWRKMGSTLRLLVEELMNYLTVCEDEFNNSFLGELSGYVEDENKMSESDNEACNVQADKEMKHEQSSDVTDDKTEDVTIHATPKRIRRVHFAPTNKVHLINLISEDSLLDLVDQNDNVSANFRSELNSSVERLRADTTALLELATSSDYENKSKLLQDLQVAKRRLADLENERETREVITEGFGENIQPGLSRRLENLAQLQDRARTVLSTRSASPEDSPHLQLLEQLCQEGDRLTEESRREIDDLQQQVSLATSPLTHSVCCHKVDAADKQLRATRKFLEDQAAEREQERDEFLHEIGRLQEMLRERERDLSEQQRLAKEVEALEQQGKDALALQQETAAQKEHLQSELKAAVDKIWVLREIITELEGQVESKTLHEAALEQKLQDMSNLLTEQTSNHQQLADELESLRTDMENTDLLRHVAHLEEQLMRHRQHVEQLQPNSTVVHQMKSQLRELETSVDKRTKDLESLHVAPSSASCSSPSEDVSIREQMDVFRCDTPDELRSSPAPTSSPAILPMEELQRLQEKLQRHSRAEEAALKRIRDLEMQLRATRHNEEEVTAERDVLQERVEDQLLKISSLQARIDQQRRKVENEQTDAISELQNKLQSKEESLNQLRNTLEFRECEVKKLHITMQHLKEAVTIQEKELGKKLTSEQMMIQQLEQKCKYLQEEHDKLHEKFQSFSGGQSFGKYVPIPVLFETLLAEKNAEIDELRQRLHALGALDVPSTSAGVHETVSEPDRFQTRSAPISGDQLRHLSAEVSKDQLQHPSAEVSRDQSQHPSAEFSKDQDQPTSVEVSEDQDQPTSVEVSEDQDQLTSAEFSKDQDQPTSVEISEDEDAVRSESYVESKVSEVEVMDVPDLDMDEEELKKLLIRKDSEIISLKNLLGERMKNALREMRESLEGKDEVISVLKEQLLEVPNLQDEVNELKERLQKAIVSMSDEDEKLPKDKEFLQDEIDRLTKMLQEKEELIQTLQGEIDQLNESHLRQIQESASLLKQRDTFKEENERLLEKLRQVKTTEGEGDLQIKLLEAEKRIQELLDEMAQLREENNRLLEDADDLTTQVQKELEVSAQLDSSLQDKLTPLQEGVPTDAICICSTTPSTDTLNKILNKILENGIGVLTFNELSYLHQQTCTATSTMILKEGGAQVAKELTTTSQGPAVVPAKADRLQIQRQLTALENEFTRKEQEAAKKVRDLELAMRQEKKHINELRDALNLEQRRNMDLQNRLGAQSRMHADLEVEKDLVQRQSSYHEDRLQQFIVLLEQERVKVRAIEDDLQKERNNVKHLRSLLDSERQRIKSGKVKDADLIESMRIKLENAMDNETKMRFQMEQRVAPRPNKSMKSPVAVAPDELKEKCMNLEVALARQQRRLEEQQTITAEEWRRAARQLELEHSTNQQLRSELMLINTHKESLESQLATAHDQLSSRQAEVDLLHRKVRSLQEAELRHQRRYASEREEVIEKAHAHRLHLEQRVAELKQKLANQDEQSLLVNELARLRQDHADVLEQLAASKAHEMKLRQEVEKLQQEELTIPKMSEPFLERLKNMNAALDQHVKDNNEVALTLARLVEERQVLQARVRELEEHLTRMQAMEAASKASAGKRAAENATLVQEKVALQLALAQCKAEVASNQRSTDETDMDNRVRHLFGKYLRAESYRKALAWQKRYLLVALGGYQQTEATTISRLAQLSGERQATHIRQESSQNKTPRIKFKSAVIVIIAIHRMHFMVRRWYHGQYIGGGAVLSRGYSESLFSGRSSYRGPRRQGSSAASSSSWGMSSSVPRPMTLLSPPSRDQPMLHQWQTDRSQHQWRNSASPTHQSNRLSEYIDRFDVLQQRLGLAAVHPHHKT